MLFYKKFLFYRDSLVRKYSLLGISLFSCLLKCPGELCCTLSVCIGERTAEMHHRNPMKLLGRSEWRENHRHIFLVLKNKSERVKEHQPPFIPICSGVWLACKFHSTILIGLF